MSLAKEYIEGLKNTYKKFGFLEKWNHFEEIIHGASEEDIKKIENIFPDCPKSLLDILKYVDGTHYSQYGKEIVSFYFLGSDIYEYPYYLLSSDEICENKNFAFDYYSDYIERYYSEEEVTIDERIIDKAEETKWLHFSDCMNNGEISQLFIDFTPSEKGKKGQIVRFLYHPEQLKVIADSFDEYLQKVINTEYYFINEDSV